MKFVFFFIEFWNYCSHLNGFCFKSFDLLVFGETLRTLCWFETALLRRIILCCFVMWQIMRNIWHNFVCLTNTIWWKKNIYWTVLSWTVVLLLRTVISKIHIMDLILNLSRNTVTFFRSWHLLLYYWSKRTFHQLNWFLIQSCTMIWFFIIFTFNYLKVCLIIWSIFIKVIEIYPYFRVLAPHFIPWSTWLFRHSSTWINLNKLRCPIWYQVWFTWTLKRLLNYHYFRFFLVFR